MATKSKNTKVTATNSAPTKAPAEKKVSAKPIKAAAPPHVGEPAKKPAAKKTPLGGLIEPAKTAPSMQESTSKAPVKSAKKTSTKIDSVTVHPPEFAVTPPDSQDSKWQEIRQILERLKTETLREIKKSVKNGTEAVAAIEPGGDIYDQASSERDRELGLLLGDREREKIHSIDEALLRITEGEYGICEECDEEIPLGRLKAMPFTRHCVKCKSDLEKLMAQTKRVEEERAYREIPLGAEEEES
ncbi:MAG: TraR/DksA C4-type zinc finger protein [Desulfuromonadaceae bacterium]|nr:TraR/DksA C4-type zinc finger protein [Desulfuromonadaceae bacterium]MDD5105133.1 TraR/DksA C4-type zinc finger protein [Desulfuromonadaceae bacterium]